MHVFMLSLWKNRCDVIHVTENLTVSIRMKTQAQQLLQYLQSKPWMMKKDDRHLIVKKRDFRKSKERSIKNWIDRVEMSIREQAGRNIVRKYDIRKYIIRNRV